MIYGYDKPIRRVRSIEMLTISDITEIVIRDLDRYGVDPMELGNILQNYIKPLEMAADELKRKYYPDY